MADYIQQRHPSKMCPCGRAKVMTGWTSKYNPKVDGKQRCVECAMDAIYQNLKK